MYSDKFMHILSIVAQKHNTTIQVVHDEMIAAMKEGQRSTDPKVQALWNAIPRQGPELTLEEFVMYMATKARNSSS